MSIISSYLFFYSINMICVDTLLNGIAKVNCPQDMLRGFTGKILVKDYRGFNPFNPNPAYEDTVEIEAERFSIMPTYSSFIKNDNVSLFNHNLSFKIKNITDDAHAELAAMANIPVILWLEMEKADMAGQHTYLVMFDESAAKLNISGQLHGASNGYVSIECITYHKDAYESKPPYREEPPVPFTVTIGPITNAGSTTFDWSNANDVLFSYNDNSISGPINGSIVTGLTLFDGQSPTFKVWSGSFASLTFNLLGNPYVVNDYGDYDPGQFIFQ